MKRLMVRHCASLLGDPGWLMRNHAQRDFPSMGSPADQKLVKVKAYHETQWRKASVLPQVAKPVRRRHGRLIIRRRVR